MRTLAVPGRGRSRCQGPVRPVAIIRVTLGSIFGGRVTGAAAEGLASETSKVTTTMDRIIPGANSKFRSLSSRLIWWAHQSFVSKQRQFSNAPARWPGAPNTDPDRGRLTPGHAVRSVLIRSFISLHRFG